MQLCAILTKGDLASLIEQITPLRVEIRPRRVISFGRPTMVELVEDVGLRLRGDARFDWDALGVTFPVTLRAWQILLVPSFAVRGTRHVLSFDPVLEELDFKRVPAVLDGPIAEAVRTGLAAQRGKVAWDFAKHLSVARLLHAKLMPASELRLGPTGGTIVVTSTEVRLTLDFAASIKRQPAQEPEPKRRPSLLRGSRSSRNARV